MASVRLIVPAALYLSSGSVVIPTTYWPPPDANLYASVLLWAATLGATIAFAAIVVRRDHRLRASAADGAS